MPRSHPIPLAPRRYTGLVPRASIVLSPTESTYSVRVDFENPVFSVSLREDWGDAERLIGTAGGGACISAIFSAIPLPIPPALLVTAHPENTERAPVELRFHHQHDPRLYDRSYSI